MVVVLYCSRPWLAEILVPRGDLGQHDHAPERVQRLDRRQGDPPSR